VVTKCIGRFFIAYEILTLFASKSCPKFSDVRAVDVDTGSGSEIPDQLGELGRVLLRMTWTRKDA
jgi:hypothetical protein